MPLKHSIKNFVKGLTIQLLVILNCLGCVTDYEHPDIDGITDILVVEGIITDNESTITLSKSVNINDGEYYAPVYINNANVYVECDDGMLFHAEITDWGWGEQNGRYIIKTGKLNLERKYSLKIEFDNHKYASDFSYPIETPKIDSVFWTKRTKGQPVKIHVATHSQNNDVMYYRWSYKEDWEFATEVQTWQYPSLCWNSANSNDIVLGSSENTIFGQITNIITEIDPSDIKMSRLYRISVTQNAISKRAHDYFYNIKKNTENMGSIFAPTPSELRGNVVCTTDPTRPVIGYIDFSTTSQKSRYVSGENVYEEPLAGDTCIEIGAHSTIWFAPDRTPLFDITQFVVYRVQEKTGEILSYIRTICVDCTSIGTTQKPDDWPI